MHSLNVIHMQIYQLKLFILESILLHFYTDLYKYYMIHLIIQVIYKFNFNFINLI